jgi:hypothetical protein
MKKLFAFDPALVAEVQKAGALDGSLNLSDSDKDSVRSRAIVACTEWNVRDKVSIKAIAEETRVHRGDIQRYAAVGKAVLPLFPEGTVDRTGANEAYAMARKASDTIMDTTLNSLLADYAAATEAGSGSWVGLAQFAEAALTEWLAAQPVEEESEEDESEGGSTESKEPRGPLSVEDYLAQVAETTLKKAAKEGMAPEKAVRLFAEYLFMAAAQHSEEEAVVDGAITDATGQKVEQAFCAGLVVAAERVEKKSA